MREVRLGLLDEFVKIAAHSEEQAREALEQLQFLEDTKPEPAQIARYSLLGALVGPTVGIGRKMIQTGSAKKGLKEYFGENVKSTLPIGRHLLGDMTAGAVTSGAVPLVRGALDRASARRSLKHYLAEHAAEPAPGEPA